MPTRTLNFNNLTPDNLTGYTQTTESTNFSIQDLSGVVYMSVTLLDFNSVPLRDSYDII
jgi:hypothetical protein